jgi:hypothetical protein
MTIKKQTLEGVRGVPIGYKYLKDYITVLKIYTKELNDTSSKQELKRVLKEVDK